MKNFGYWHVVSNDVGHILAVYGEALLSEAQACAKRIGDSTGCPTWLHQVAGPRPSVGQSISMKNTPYG